MLELTTRHNALPPHLNEQLVELTDTALAALVEAREREGRRLTAMLLDRLGLALARAS